MKNPWFSRPRPTDGADLRLLVFHHAGGSAAAYHKWHKHVPDWVDLVLVELPGRGRRFQEEAITDFDALIPKLAGQIGLEIAPPFAFFGHSLGALISFELAHQTRGLVALGISSFLPPIQENAAQRAVLSGLKDEDLIARVAKFAPLPPELIRETEFLKIYLDVIRSDLKLIESYRLKSRPPLATPSMVFGGRNDAAVGPEKLDGWKTLTRVEGPAKIFDGDHFYINQNFPEILAAFLSMIQPLCADK